ncbi:hypothetical protein [Niveibacterium terrae]|uniref:hypothetical protein n=1 Tax=Niveibacterium terrae TaxID=3373598 RepID=UPI003A8D4D40
MTDPRVNTQLRRAIDEYAPRIDDYPVPKRFKFPLREAIDASICLVKNGFEDASTARGVAIAMGLPEQRAVEIFGAE